MMPPKKTFSKYWAFVSYSSHDQQIAKWLHRRLEGYVLPESQRNIEAPDGRKIGKYLRPIFRDRDELSGSAELGPALQDAILASEYLIVLCSTHSAQSKWVDLEIQDFIQRGESGKILALIIDGEPNATSNPQIESARECFPPSLRYPLEPLAGDLRKEADGKERGLFKVIAGLTGISFEKLYRRHERARRKRLVIGSTIVASVMVALVGLTIFAFVKERKATESAKAEKKAREASDDLVAFMVEDLYEELRKTGRLNALGSAVTKIQEHQEKNPTSASNRLRTGKNQMNVLFETGKPEEATKLAADLIQEAEGDVELQGQLASLHLSLADYLAWTDEGLEEAIRYADFAIDFYDQDEAEPVLLAKAYNYRGDAQRALGLLKKSLESYQKALSIFREHPSLIDHIIPRTYDRLGEVLAMTGRLDDAQKHYLLACEESQRGESAVPHDHEWRCDHAVARSKVTALASSGLTSVREAHEMLTELVKIEYSNARWRLELAKVKALLAESEVEPLNEEERLKLSDESLALFESLTLDNPDQPIWLQNLAHTYIKRGAMNEEASCFEQALVVCDRCPHDSVMTELAMVAVVQLVWAEKEPGKQLRHARHFGKLWERLPEVKKKVAQNQNAYCLMCIEEAVLLKKHRPIEQERITELLAQAEKIIEGFTKAGIGEEQISPLRAQLKEAKNL